MSVFIDRTAVLAAAKVPRDTFNQPEIADRIIADGEVRTIAMQLAIDAYILEAIPRVNRDRLYKRVGIHVPVPVPKAGWHVELTANTGKYYIIHRAPSGELFRFGGYPDAAAKALQSFGEIPPEILDEYRHCCEGNGLFEPGV